jgi:arylsulfatase A-like enzyme/Flp pilus assembly protein TadD
MTTLKKNQVLFILAAGVVLTGAAVLVFFYLTKGERPGGVRVVPSPSANVLLITLDTTRPDRLGAYGYAGAVTPEFDRLARAGVLFQNAYAPVPLTLPSHASILTGTYPIYHGVRNNGKYLLLPQAETLAEILKSAGYATAAFVSSFILDSRFGLDQGFDYYGDRMDGAVKVKNLESERRADSVYNDFAQWLGQHPGGKFFAWVHFFDPHFPYDPPEPFRSDPRLPDPYDGEIACMDENIGKIIRLLQEKNLLDLTLVILAGDHGEAFGEHGENGHTIFCYEENIRVPFVIAFPGEAASGGEIAERVNLIDIVPTVLGYLDINAPEAVQGKSLIPLVEGRKTERRDLYFESLYAQDVLGCAPLTGVLSGPHKFIRLPRPELYDLEADRAEKSNLLEADPGEARRMMERLVTLEKEFSGTEWTSERTLSPEERERLKSLGYLSVGERRDAQAQGLDPKDRIGFWNQSLLAGQKLAERNFGEAEALLLGLFEEDPSFLPVIENLGEVYFQEGKIASLRGLFEDAIARNPGKSALNILYGSMLVRLDRADEAISVLRAAEALAGPDEKENLFFALGTALGRQGLYEEAIQSFNKVLEIEPENFEASRLVGYAQMQLGRFEDALSYFRAAEKGMPDNPRLLEDMAISLAELRRFEEAIPYFERAVKVNPAAPIYANYALACAGTGDHKQAIVLMEKAVSLPDADAELRSLAQRYLIEWRKE